MHVTSTSPHTRRVIRGLGQTRIALGSGSRFRASGNVEEHSPPEQKANRHFLQAPIWRGETLEAIHEADLVNRAGVAEALETVVAVIGAHAARADAAERQIVLRDMHERAVERHAA